MDIRILKRKTKFTARNQFIYPCRERSELLVITLFRGQE